MFSELIESDDITEHEEEDKEKDVDRANPDESPEAEDNSSQIWICEFCQAKNRVNIKREKIPTGYTVDYVLKMEEAKKGEEAKCEDDAPVIFCIDTSGSMSNTVYHSASHTSVHESVINRIGKAISARPHPLTSKNASRLDCVRGAIGAHMSGIGQAGRERKVGLVTFDRTVTVVGDGSEAPRSIGGGILYDYTSLLENAQEVASTHMKKNERSQACSQIDISQPSEIGQPRRSEYITKNIAEATEDLMWKVCALSPKHDASALGPAVLTSIVMAAEGGYGSTVFICTDGLANAGTGAIQKQDKGSKKSTSTDGTDPQSFYEMLADYANEKGVTVNIIGVDGKERDLETLIALSKKTGGSVNLMNPLKMKECSIIRTTIMSAAAPDVTVKVLLHRALEFRNEDESDLNESKTLVRKVVGDATKSRKVTFEYKVKDAEDLQDIGGFDIEELDGTPFQAIIEYTKLDGVRCIRTFTQKISTFGGMN